MISLWQIFGIIAPIATFHGLMMGLDGLGFRPTWAIGISLTAGLALILFMWWLGTYHN